MSFDEFVVDLNAEIKEFNAYWLAEHAKNPEAFPLEMGCGDWDEQFRAWQSVR